MKSVTRPPLDANGVGHAGDDLDEVLFAFFRSEMPQPWPPLKLPDRTPPAPKVRPVPAAPAPTARPWFRSPHFALAASVALLIGGYALLSAALTPPAKSDNPPALNEKVGADPKSNLRDMSKDPLEPGDLDFHEWLEQDPNKPTTYHMQLTPKK
jgi:hypothetical protein